MSPIHCHFVEVTLNPIISFIMPQPGISHHALGLAVNIEQLWKVIVAGESRDQVKYKYVCNMHCVQIATDYRLELHCGKCRFQQPWSLYEIWDIHDAMKGMFMHMVGPPSHMDIDF